MDVADSIRAKIEPLREQLFELWERTGDDNLRQIAADEVVLDGVELHDQQLLDWVSTALMNCYRESHDPRAFGLLYELNEHSFRIAIQAKLRRSTSRVDARDVLQEVFLNIYRYPHRFLAEKPDSFRNWGHRIVRNTLLKFLKGEARRSRFTPLDEDVGQRPDAQARSPLRSATDAETAVIADRAFVLYLNLYLVHFRRLSAKEQRALTMVEVEGASYKATAAALEIRLENLKMVIFRGRRKIYRGMNRSLARMSALHQPDSGLVPVPNPQAPSLAPRHDGLRAG